MKIVRYRGGYGEGYGILDKQAVFSLPQMATRLNASLPERIDDFVAQEDALETAETIFRRANPKDLEAVAATLSEVKLLAPLVFPPKIICLGWNYVDHAQEKKVELPEEPVIFMKPHTALVGPGENIVKPSFVKELDYEGELAVVMGKRCKNVSVEDALGCVFGYTILNDVSARDFQFKDQQWTRGKSFDTFAPIGPCITTRKQLPKTDTLSIRTWVNDELRQDGNTRDMVFTVAEIIYHLSRVMTLEPCDVISTGTPSGVAMAMKPPKWLKDGDVVHIEIEGIGTLENSVEEK